MLTRFTIRAGLFAGAAALLLATQADITAAASASTVEWLVGPLALAAGQSLDVLVGDFTVQATGGEQIFAGTVSARSAPVPLVLVIGTIGNPNILPAGRGLVVGFKDPDLLPPARKPVQARVRITAPVTLAQLRRTLVSLVVSGGTTGRAESVAQQ